MDNCTAIKTVRDEDTSDCIALDKWIRKKIPVLILTNHKKK